jgi:predicted transcriptional regulator
MINISNEEIKQVVEDITLDMFNIGADKTNYKILKILPTDLKAVMKELELTKMPVNTRLNELEKVGLVKRRKGTGKVVPTEMTGYFLDLIDNIRAKVEESVKLQVSELN